MKFLWLNFKNRAVAVTSITSCLLNYHGKRVCLHH